MGPRRTRPLTRAPRSSFPRLRARGRSPPRVSLRRQDRRTLRSRSRSVPTRRPSRGGRSPSGKWRSTSFTSRGRARRRSPYRAGKEPLDELPLAVRAQRLSDWLTPSRRATASNQRYWLYQHAWIVAGAKFGWWHGAAALRVLINVDRRVESQWGIGHQSESVARRR